MRRRSVSRRAASVTAAPAPVVIDALTCRPMKWTVYLLAAAKRTYVGITTDLRRRLDQHNGERRGGARSTRAGRP